MCAFESEKKRGGEKVVGGPWQAVQQGLIFFAHYVNNVNFASENVNSVSPPNRSEKAGRGTENAFRRHTLGERKSCLGERKSCRPNSDARSALLFGVLKRACFG